jgi:hypothetical protein
MMCLVDIRKAVGIVAHGFLACMVRKNLQGLCINTNHIPNLRSTMSVNSSKSCKDMNLTHNPINAPHKSNARVSEESERLSTQEITATHTMKVAQIMVNLQNFVFITLLLLNGLT